LNNVNDFIKNSINEGMNTFADVPVQEADAPLEEQKSDAELSMSESGRSQRFSSNFEEIQIEESPADSNIIQPRKMKKKQKK